MKALFKWIGRVLVGVLVLAALGLGYGMAVGLPGSPPSDVGVLGGKLYPCRDSPNCVNSFATEGYPAIAPLPMSGPVDAAMARLRAEVEKLPRVSVVRADGGYLYVTQTSRLMGYVDDVEFLADPGASVIHVRSASRLGYRDMGVNRARIEAIRAGLTKP